MTDKELIQALKHCGDPDEATCYGCPARKMCRTNPGLPIERMAADRLEALLAENEHLREVTKMIPQWVSVSERLPENGTDVLALSNDGIEIRAYPANYDYGKWFDCLFMEQNRNTTHWQPLPEPPSTEGVE